jgi:hypothetical protein
VCERAPRGLGRRLEHDELGRLPGVVPRHAEQAPPLELRPVHCLRVPTPRNGELRAGVRQRGGIVTASSFRSRSSAAASSPAHCPNSTDPSGFVRNAQSSAAWVAPAALRSYVWRGRTRRASATQAAHGCPEPGLSSHVNVFTLRRGGGLGLGEKAGDSDHFPEDGRMWILILGDFRVRPALLRLEAMDEEKLIAAARFLWNYHSCAAPSSS